MKSFTIFAITTLLPESHAFGSFSSSFTRTSNSIASNNFASVTNGINNDMMTMYEPSFDPSDLAKQKLKGGFWVALDHTEKWIESTLEGMPRGHYNFSYECDMSQSVLQSIASIFRRFREARMMGENHERVEAKSSANNPQYKPEALRHTSVIIIPFCEYFDEFSSFENVIGAVTKARRESLDFVTNSAITKKEHSNWSVFVNDAFMHPKFQINKEEISGRQSPYPTIIMEVSSQPEEELVLPSHSDSTKNVVKSLESLFEKSAVLHKKTDGNKSSNDSESAFWDNLGKVDGIEEVLPENLVELTEDWIIEMDSSNLQDAHFSNSNVEHPDAAFEFVFTKLAMFNHMELMDSLMPSRPELTPGERTYAPGPRSFLILPKFLSSSATSFEAFARGVDGIISCIDGLADRLQVYHYHPEHIDVEKRAPAPTLVFQWYEIMQWYDESKN